MPLLLQIALLWLPGSLHIFQRGRECSAEARGHFLSLRSTEREKRNIKREREVFQNCAVGCAQDFGHAWPLKPAPTAAAHGLVETEGVVLMVAAWADVKALTLDNQRTASD